MTVDAKVDFVVDGTTNNGKIRLFIETFGASVTVADLNVYWGVTDPNGIVIKSYLAPDPFPGVNADAYLGSPDSLELLLDIPIGSDGNYVLGEYVFQLYLKDGELDNDLLATYVVEKTWQFDFQTVVENETVFGAASLATAFNCATAEITATDNTSLDGYTLIERVLRLTPPDVPGNPAPVVVTTPSAGISETFLWNNATYQTSLSVKRSYAQDDSDTDMNAVTTVKEMLTAQSTLSIVCGTEMCDAAACLNDTITTLEDLACSQGSWANIAQKDMNLALRPLFYGVSALLYKECGNYNASAEKAAIVGDCDCDCGSAATTSNITPYTPPN